MSTAEATSRPIVSAFAQPFWVARVMAYTSTINPPVIEAAPAESKWRWSRSARLSRRSTGLSASTSRPTGTLMKKIHDQLKALVSAPPRSTPAAPPLPDTAPQMPSALLRSRPSRNSVVSIERAAGETSAAPSPCSERNTISDPSDHANPSSKELTVKRRIPATKSRRRPSRSASRPPRRSAPPKKIE